MFLFSLVRTGMGLAAEFTTQIEILQRSTCSAAEAPRRLLGIDAPVLEELSVVLSASPSADGSAEVTQQHVIHSSCANVARAQHYIHATTHR